MNPNEQPQPIQDPTASEQSARQIGLGTKVGIAAVAALGLTGSALVGHNLMNSTSPDAAAQTTPISPEHVATAPLSVDARPSTMPAQNERPMVLPSPTDHRVNIGTAIKVKAGEGNVDPITNQPTSSPKPVVINDNEMAPTPAHSKSPEPTPIVIDDGGMKPTPSPSESPSPTPIIIDDGGLNPGSTTTPPQPGL